MKKKLLAIISVALVCVLVCASVLFYTNKKGGATIFVATDTHYLSPRINDGGTAFQQMLSTSDGKLVDCSEEIMDAFCDKVIEAQPDVLILSGDLTFKGEKASHEDLTQKLNRIQESGVQVLTIAGNHDINSKDCAQYSGDEITLTDNVDAEEFKELYYNFGMAQAESVDTYSLSYSYKVNDKLYVLMLDTNSYGQNFLPDPSYEWLEAQLKAISDKGAKVITVSHQNLFAHNDQLSFGYQLYDANDLLELFEKYSVKLNLTGHIHMQHIKTDGITEIATSSLLVSPVQYGVLDIDKNIDYHTERLAVDSIPDFEAYAHQSFINSGIYKTSDMLSQMDLTDEQRDLIANTFAEINSSYFAGTTMDVTPYQEGIDLIRTQDGGFLKQYIELLIDEAQNDYTKITIK